MTSEKHETIVLDKKLCIEQASDLVATLETSLAPDATLTIDASAVESIDTAGFQALLAFVTDAANVSSTVQWSGADGVVRDLARLADLDAALDLDNTVVAVEDDDLCPVF